MFQIFPVMALVTLYVGEGNKPQLCHSFSQSSKNILINPFHATGHFLYQLKASRHQKFFDVFRGYSKTAVARNGLINQNHAAFLFIISLYLLLICFAKFEFDF